MPATTSPVSTLPHHSMEDRKRPALGGSDDIGPPSKRQAVNGGGRSSRDESGDTREEAWIEEYAKGAIYRQMAEYKRQCHTLEERLEETQRRSKHHDDHLRVLDNWCVQLFEEIGVIAQAQIDEIGNEAKQIFPSRIRFKNMKDFESHLQYKFQKTTELAQSLLNRLASTRDQLPDNVSELEEQVTTLLANQKEFQIQIDRQESEKEDLSEQLNTATLRYMKAERKIDRLKSLQVQKMEQQALATSTAKPGEGGAGGGGDDTLTEGEFNGNAAAMECDLKEAKVEAKIKTERLEEGLTRNKKLQEELTACQTRLASLSDEDYARTDIFKNFKTSHEDLIKKLNNMEALSKKTDERASKLEKERHDYRSKLQEEAQLLTSELETSLQQSDTNLARVRANRDELHAEAVQLKAARDQERNAIDSMKDLVSAQEARIHALESEVQRLRPSDDVTMTDRPDIDELPVATLREKLKKLQQDYDSINNELPGLTAAVKKYQATANKKVMDFAGVEDRLGMAIAEKAKANQRYFDAHKTSDQYKAEVTKLRSMHSQSSDIITQLKENESNHRALTVNLEKQLTNLRSTNKSVMDESKRQEASSVEAIRRFDSLKSQIVELTSISKTKDAYAAHAKEQLANLETELEKTKLRLDHLSKDRDKWKTKSLNNSSEEEEMLRSLATCSICRSNFKNTVLKTCGHIFCRSCVDDRVQNRFRKCPACSKQFDGKLDVMQAHL